MGHITNKRQRASAPLRIRVLQSALPSHVKSQLFCDLIRANDKYVSWVEQVLTLPSEIFCESSKITRKEKLRRAQSIMDSTVTGHAHAKLEVMKIVCCENASSYAIGLEGPAGIGKTHFVRNAIGETLRRPVHTIPLGGATDTSYLLGSVYTYEGSRPGRLATALIESKCVNPILFFDELDKVSATERGAEIISVLIHLIDPTMNSALRDRYFHGIDIDFSKCTFVFCYNDASRISPILLDRIKRVRMSVPSAEERKCILSDHILPRVQRRLGVGYELTRDAEDFVLSGHTEGMRDVEKDVEHVLSMKLLTNELEEKEDTRITVKFCGSVLARREQENTCHMMYL